MAESGDDNNKGFTVTDRRVSSQADEDVQAQTPSDSVQEKVASEYQDAKQKVSERAAAQPGQASPQGALPPIDFMTFVLSLSTSALMHLGHQIDPNQPAQVNLDMARQTIDLLGVLEQKTKGNLTGEEERLMQQILTDLRMRYVAHAP